MTPLPLLLALLPAFGTSFQDREASAEERSAAEDFLRRFDAACRSGDRREVGRLLFESAPSCRRRCESVLLPCLPLVGSRSELLLLREIGRASCRERV